jgi:hypothetical protein
VQRLQVDDPDAVRLDGFQQRFRELSVSWTSRNAEAREEYRTRAAVPDAPRAQADTTAQCKSKRADKVRAVC